MIATIENEYMTVDVDDHGAELQSIRTDDIEFLWQGDPDVWGRRAPILFPIIGRLAGDVLRLKGVEYPMNQHGFARDSQFTLLEQYENMLRYRLVSNSQSLRIFPYSFMLDIVYVLSGNVLQVDLQVNNCGRDLMPFAIGGHPAFACDWFEDDDLTNYYLQFAEPETASRMFLEDGLVTDRTELILEQDDVIALTPDLFNEDAIILRDLDSDYVSLCNDQSDIALTVEFPRFPYLGIWAKPGAPFVCLEPWFGHADPVGFDGEFTHKRGSLRLAPGEWFTCYFRIILNNV